MSQDVKKTLSAIYETLMEFLPQVSVFKAMLHYERKFSAEPSFPVAHFLKNVCDVERIPDKRNVMMQSLVAKLHFNNELADPRVAIAYQDYKKAQRESSEVVKSSIEVVIFQRLVIAILKQVDAQERSQLESYVAEHSDDFIADSELRERFVSWVTRQKKGLNTSQASFTDLQGGVNAFYVAMCELCGPIEADRKLSSAKIAASANLNAEQKNILNKML